MNPGNRFGNVFLIGLLACPLAGTAAAIQQGGGGQAADASATSEAKTQIMREPSLNSSGSAVETARGVVRLSGFADSRAGILTVVQMAQSVSGVVSVTNDLQVK